MPCIGKQVVDGDCEDRHARARQFELCSRIARRRRLSTGRIELSVIRPIQRPLIPADPSRVTGAPLDRDLYAERREAENFFQRIKRFRCVALRCEKTLSGVMGFVFLVSALAWLSRIQAGPAALMTEARVCRIHQCAVCKRRHDLRLAFRPINVPAVAVLRLDARHRVPDTRGR